MPWYINGFPYVSFNNTSISMGYLVFYSTSSVDHQWMTWCCIQHRQYNNRFPGDIFKIICISIESQVFHSTASVYINGFPCVSLGIISISIIPLKAFWCAFHFHQDHINGVPGILFDISSLTSESLVFHSITSVYINGFPCVSLGIICISPWCFIE